MRASDARTRLCRVGCDPRPSRLGLRLTHAARWAWLVLPPSPLTARLPRAALQVPAGGSELPGWHGGTGVSGVRGPGSPGRGDEGMRSLKGASTRPSQQPQEGSLAGNGGKGKRGVRRASPSKRHVSLLTCEGNRDHHRSHGDPEGGGPGRSGLERRPLGRRGQPLLASGTVLCRDARGSLCPCDLRPSGAGLGRPVHSAVPCPCCGRLLWVEAALFENA